MNPSRPFILRPVATSLGMLAILLSGIIAYRVLPISALPQVDYPTIQITTLYPGASPDVMTSSVTAPLERQLGQMPGLNQMSSSSSGGASVITLQFSLNLSLDIAEQEVQAAINASGTFLPTDLPMPPIYSKVNPADAPVLTLAVSSGTLKLPALQNLVDTRIAQKISQLPGVGLVAIAGGQRPAVRIQANPRALAAYGLSMDDLKLELAFAIGLVVMVIFLFLRNAAATTIPSVAVPLSLVGTFGVMYLAGFSINNLTLMALVIATGFVVDDAIVVIENITRYIEGAGDRPPLSPLEAALKGSEQIGFTIIS